MLVFVWRGEKHTCLITAGCNEAVERVDAAAVHAWCEFLYGCRGEGSDNECC